MVEYEMDDLTAEIETTSKTSVMPAFEYVKRNILYSWFNIESAYEKYIYLTATNKDAKHELYRINSKVLTLYKLMLRPMILRVKLKEEIIKEFDGYIQNNYTIPDDKVNKAIEDIASFLHAIGLTNIAYEVKPWQERFKDSYGVFD